MSHLQRCEPRRLLVLVLLSSAIAAALSSGLGTDLTAFAQRPAGVGTVTGQVDVHGSDRPFVVYVEGPETSRLPPTEAQVIQRDRSFEPGVLAVTRGSEIGFPNEDRIFHNVFSLSRTKRFDLGLYRSGESRSVRFTRTGVVDVYCNIHPEMVAHILVVDTPHFAVVRPGARFLIPDVPVGTHTLVAWQRYGEEARRELTVERGSTARVDIRMDAGRGPRSHPRKDGSPYGRYQ